MKVSLFKIGESLFYIFEDISINLELIVKMKGKIYKFEMFDEDLKI